MKELKGTARNSIITYQQINKGIYLLGLCRQNHGPCQIIITCLQKYTLYNLVK